jgi:hypothetical protein
MQKNQRNEKDPAESRQNRRLGMPECEKLISFRAKLLN